MTNNVSRRQFVELSGLVAAGLGLVGCGGGSASSSSDSIKVGIMGPFSGDVAQYGIACRNGAQLYFKQLNEKGGVNGKQIDMDVQDEKGDATEAVSVYNKLVQDGVTAIVGDVTSTPTIAVAQASVTDNMPCVTASATAADVITFGSNYFRACITDPFQGKVMADFAAKQGYKTVGTIYNSGGDYEVGVEKAFVEEAQSKGITITSEQGYPAGATDFNGQLTSIIADNQDYASAEDLEGCFYDTSFSASNTTSSVQDFVKAYTDEYGEAPTNFCALGYDAAAIMAAGLEAAEKSGESAGSDAYKQAVIDGIAAAKVSGVTGDISYSGTGDPVKSTLIITFKDGKEEIFDTIDA